MNEKESTNQEPEKESTEPTQELTEQEQKDIAGGPANPGGWGPGHL